VPLHGPHRQDDIPRIVRGLPDVDCLVMGSDSPHAEGLAEPLQFVGLLDGLTENRRLALLRGDAGRRLARFGGTETDGRRY
jgi:hypothetical protein